MIFVTLHIKISHITFDHRSFDYCSTVDYILFIKDMGKGILKRGNGQIYNFSTMHQVAP